MSDLQCGHFRQTSRDLTAMNLFDTIRAAADLAEKKGQTEIIPALLEAQRQTLDLMDRLRQTEEKLSLVEGFQERKDDYVRCKIGKGIAYAFREPKNEVELVSYFCCACYENQKISTLQPLHPWQRRSEKRVLSMR